MDGTASRCLVCALYKVVSRSCVLMLVASCVRVWLQCIPISISIPISVIPHHLVLQHLGALCMRSLALLSYLQNIRQ